MIRLQAGFLSLTSGALLKGNYSSWLEQKNELLAQENKNESSRQKEIQCEMEWIHMGAKESHAKHKEHLIFYNELMVYESKISIPDFPCLGGQVIDIKNLTKSLDGKLMLEILNVHIPSGAIIDIVRPNCAGKQLSLRWLSMQMVLKAEKSLIQDLLKFAIILYLFFILSNNDSVKYFLMLQLNN